MMSTKRPPIGCYDSAVYVWRSAAKVLCCWGFFAFPLGDGVMGLRLPQVEDERFTFWGVQLFSLWPVQLRRGVAEWEWAFWGLWMFCWTSPRTLSRPMQLRCGVVERWRACACLMALSYWESDSVLESEMTGEGTLWSGWEQLAHGPVWSEISYEYTTTFTFVTGGDWSTLILVEFRVSNDISLICRSEVGSATICSVKRQALTTCLARRSCPLLGCSFIENLSEEHVR